jgi:hypothetical protein
MTCNMCFVCLHTFCPKHLANYVRDARAETCVGLNVKRPVSPFASIQNQDASTDSISRIRHNKSPFRELRNGDGYFRNLTLQKGDEFHNFVQFIFGTPYISRDVCPVFCAHVPISIYSHPKKHHTQYNMKLCQRQENGVHMSDMNEDWGQTALPAALSESKR